MIAPIVLSLDDVAYCDLLKLVTKGALRPGRITSSGAVVYELTCDGVAAVEAWAEDSDQEVRDRGQGCLDGECEHAADHKSARDLLNDAEQKLDDARDALFALGEALVKARISDAAKAALARLGQELAT